MQVCRLRVEDKLLCLIGYRPSLLLGFRGGGLYASLRMTDEDHDAAGRDDIRDVLDVFTMMGVLGDIYRWLWQLKHLVGLYAPVALLSCRVCYMLALVSFG